MCVVGVVCGMQIDEMNEGVKDAKESTIIRGCPNSNADETEMANEIGIQCGLLWVEKWRHEEYVKGLLVL